MVDVFSDCENNKFNKDYQDRDEDQIGPASPERILVPNSFAGLPSEGTGRPRGIARSPYNWQPD
eukprot:10024457-Heterocapsa_arctica.AAC.1